MKKNVFRLTLLSVMVLLTATVMLSGCTNVKKRANTADTWSMIKQRNKVIIGLDDSFVPMGFREKNGQLVGYDIDLARAVFKKYGIKVDFQTIDWSMKETELRNGTIDLIWNGYTKSPARAKTVAFSNTYLKNEQILVTKKKEQIKQAADMQGKVLGLQSGSSGYQSYVDTPKLLKQYVKSSVQYDTFNDAFLDLNAGRIQGLLIDSVYANYYIKHQNDSASYREMPIGFPKEDFAVGMRKGDKTLRLKINNALHELYQEQTMKNISEKWFGVDNSVDDK